jgi:heme-degrading monooxygenase HmoA
MHVRINTLHGDKGQVDAAIEFVEATVRPKVEALTGNRGMATLVDRDAGVTFVASYWDDAPAMADSESAITDVRQRAGVVGGGDVTVERYEVAVAQRLRLPAAGAPIRMLRTENDPARTDETVAFYRDQLLPQILGLPGMCSVQLLVDRNSGRGMSITAWDDEAAVTAAGESLDRLRNTATEQLGLRITGLDTYTMVHTSVRLD